MVFKTWQIILFSLIPLALVFAGVIGGSFHGVDSAKEPTPTAAPQVVTTQAPTTPQAGGSPATGATTLDLTATNLLYDKRSLTVAANASVVIQFSNRDSGVQHNFSVYKDRTAAQSFFKGDLTTGPTVKQYTFTAPAAGTYYFRCDVHPDTMNGTFTVR